MNPQGKTTISIMIDRNVRERASRTKAIWKDLGAIFQELAQRFTQSEIELILRNHPLGAGVVEALPE